MTSECKDDFFGSKLLNIGIIVCGYVDLLWALRFCELGHRVTGFDTDPEKVQRQNTGKNYILHISEATIAKLVAEEKFDATTDIARLKEKDAVLICVPTPLDERREPDLGYVEQT